MRADITPTGDVSPSSPSSWSSSTTGYIGNTASGTLTVNGGSDLLSGLAYIGYASTAAGVVTVDGAGSTWTNSGADFGVGRMGSGTLWITNGGSISSTGGYNYNTYIAYGPGSTGMVTVSGTGSMWNNLSLDVGQFGGGTLSIANGGSVISRDGFSAGSNIGLYSGSTGVVTVDGANSTWATGPLTVGSRGGGTLSITNGGTVDSIISSFGDTRIGQYSGSSGMVTVDGSGSIWMNTTLYVGDKGIGRLAITNGGSVSVANETYVGVNVGASGTIDFGTNGGTLTTRCSLCRQASSRVPARSTPADS